MRLHHGDAGWFYFNLDEVDGGSIVGQKMKRVVPVLLSCLLLAACGKWSLDTEWKSGEFRLIAVDAKSQMTLIHENSAVSLVGPTVFAVGADEKHIVLKQHPVLDAAGTKFDRAVTHYFIVGRDKSVRGPLTKEEFEGLASALSLPPFSKVFDELR